MVKKLSSLLIISFLYSPVHAAAAPAWCERLLVRLGLQTAYDIRPLEPEDMPRILAYAEDPRIHGMMGGRDIFVKELDKVLDETMYLNWVITANDKPVGMISMSGVMSHLAPEEKWLYLGYFVDPEHWNKGLASRFLGEIMSDLFAKDLADGIFAVVKMANYASIRVMDRLGFARVPAKEGFIYFIKMKSAEAQRKRAEEFRDPALSTDLENDIR